MSRSLGLWLGALLLSLLVVSPLAEAARRKRKVVRTEEMCECMGRLEHPLVVVVVAPRPSPSVAAATLVDGLRLADGRTQTELVAATAAFEKAVGAPGPLEEPALYELARVRRRLDDLDGAATRFAQILELPSPLLRAEALRELAEVLSDSCAEGSLAKVRAFLAARAAAAWRGELWRTVGDVQFERSRSDTAVEAYREAAAIDGKTAPPVEVGALCNTAALQPFFNGLRPRFAACRADASARRSGCSGRVGLAVRLRLDGTMGVTAEEGGSCDAPFAKCLVDALGATKAPSPEVECRAHVALILE